MTTYLTENTSNDFEKVRSFYIWLANHIEYDNAAVEPGSKRINHSNQDVLNRKKAVCQGYSNLFKEMCRLSKIPCEVVSGYPKTPRDAPPDPRLDHDRSRRTQARRVDAGTGLIRVKGTAPPARRTSQIPLI